MKVHTQAVQLSNRSGEATVVKQGALMTFRALRALGSYIAEIPAVATQVANDVGEAWRESSRPNA